MKKFFTWLDRTFIKPIENSKMPLGTFILIAYGYMVVRDMLEGVLETPGIGLAATTIITIEMLLMHFPLFYFMLFTVAIILIHFSTGHDIRKITRVLFIYSFIILIAPLVDPLFRPGGYNLAYPGDPRMILQGIKATFGLGKFYYGSSPGMLMEGYLGALLVAIYSGLRAPTTRRKVISILLAPLILIVATLTAGGLQMVVGAIFGGGVYATGGLISSATRKYSLVLLLPLIPLIWLGLWRYSREKVRLLLRSLKPFLLVLSALAAGAGFLFGWLNLRDVLVGVPRNPFDYIALFALLVLGVLAGSASLFFGNAYDPAVDTGDRRTYRRAAGGLFVLSMLLAWCLGYTALFIVIAFFVCGLVLHTTPLRLSRFAVSSSFFYALGMFILVAAGYSLFGMERTLSVFPWQLGLAVFLPLWAVLLGREFILRRARPRFEEEGEEGEER
ncbi:MAG: hypothetical protein U9Q76_07945 [candidate division WOR-3 bacterium]|nr:hypothetical protein [candidate division WOR-3 bacterium]